MSEDQDLKSEMDTRVEMIRRLQQAPIWTAWAYKRGMEVEVGTRKGVPRGEKIPFGFNKSFAAIFMTLYPRGFKTTAEIGKSVDVSGELIRKWRREKRFQEHVKSLEIQFAQFVLNNLSAKDFLMELYNVPQEPFVWSNGILEIFHLELANTLGIIDEAHPDGTGKARLRSYLENKFSQVSDYIPFQSILELPQDPDPDFPVYKFLLRDLGLAAMRAIKTRGGKRGRKPYEDVRQQTVAVMDQFTKQHPISELRLCLNYIEEGLRTGQSKDDLLSLVEQARYIINIAFSEKQQEEGISIDNLIMRENEPEENTD